MHHNLNNFQYPLINYLAPELEMTHNATGLGDITKPANLELSDLDVSNNLEITKPEFNNDSCIDQEVNGAR
jgi:hypothetical protein